MSIEDKDVRRIARLARLNLTEDEVKLYQGQLTKILDSMKELEALDVSGVPPTTSAVGEVRRGRPDEPRPFANTEAILANAPERDGPFFKVKKVIE